MRNNIFTNKNFIKLSSKSFYLVSLFLLITFNQSRVGSELPSTDIQLTHRVHQIIDAKKAVKIDSFFAERHEKWRMNGTVLVAEKGRIVYEKAFGFADFRNKIPLNINSPFQLASVSKPLTATAVLKLYEEGKLDLDDNIRKFFPRFPYDGITIRLLLTHRSGLPNYMYFVEDYWPDRHKPISNKDVLDIMMKHKPAIYYLPDRRYNYCNTNYALLASIIEKVSGHSFADFMKENIFDPAGMKNTRIYNKTRDSQFPSDVIGYTRYGRRAIDSYLNGVVGDKGVYATVEDLLAFDQALQTGVLLRKQTLREAYKPEHKDLRIWDNYGLGWRVNAADPHDRLIYHTGWWKGFKTYLIRKVDEDKTIIVLTNTARSHFIPVRKLAGLI